MGLYAESSTCGYVIIRALDSPAPAAWETTAALKATQVPNLASVPLGVIPEAVQEAIKSASQHDQSRVNQVEAELKTLNAKLVTNATETDAKLNQMVNETKKLSELTTGRFQKVENANTAIEGAVTTMQASQVAIEGRIGQLQQKSDEQFTQLMLAIQNS